MISPLTRKRFLAFRRIRRAWWSLLGLAGLFVFSMAAELVCPFDPNEVINPNTLNEYRETVAVRAIDVRTARFNLLPDGSIADFEGPPEVREAVGGKTAAAEMKGGVLDEYRVSVKDRLGYKRVFLAPKDAPKMIDTGKTELREVAWPFRPVPSHPFGIDSAGRDVYSRVVHGMRISLLFGLLLTAIGVVGGFVIGALEGYFGGWVDILGQRFTEIWNAMPFLYVMIFVGATVGRSFTLLLICYALFNWITVSYYVRAEFLRLRSRPFVEAARCQGFSTARILFCEILPNALTPVVTLFPFLLMGAIGSLAALDFLGFGLPAMTPSWGELLSQASQFRGAWWLIAFPAGALFIVMLLTVLVGEGLRDAFDPRRHTLFK